MDVVTADDASVNASIGGDLAGFTADVEFNVEDTANAIAAEVAASGFGSGGLDEANNLIVSGGNVDVAEAADIQSISGYDDSASDYDITDTAAALISAVIAYSIKQVWMLLQPATHP